MRRSHLVLLAARLVLGLAMAGGAFAAASKNVSEIDAGGLLKRINGEQGKVVVVNVFASWCPPCRVEVPDLVAVNKKYADKGVVIISLSVDEDSKVVAPFMKTMNMDYPVYMAGRDITKAFQVSSIPHNVFYAKSGQRVISEPGIADTEMLEMVFNKLLVQNYDVTGTIFIFRRVKDCAFSPARFESRA